MTILVYIQTMASKSIWYPVLILVTGIPITQWIHTSWHPFHRFMLQFYHSYSQPKNETRYVLLCTCDLDMCPVYSAHISLDRCHWFCRSCYRFLDLPSFEKDLWECIQQPPNLRLFVGLASRNVDRQMGRKCFRIWLFLHLSNSNGFAVVEYHTYTYIACILRPIWV